MMECTAVPLLSRIVCILVTREKINCSWITLETQINATKSIVSTGTIAWLGKRNA